LKLKCDVLLSNFAFNFNLRRYTEDENFRLFNYVNELNQEIEKLEEQISDIKNEIEKYKGQGVNTDNQRKKILKDLEAGLP
jgi:TolA-binding protein